ncbi:esterase [Pelagivirga sediminicola]|uniref:Esterase n=1 Tax=Pelagivirga sediminicola TaxID=2170575 RepID=A0A2T7G6Q3_9RHOB|nr:alpha/beta hydrolase [Pelagivirga sediminicola]PVA10099.1 esterase [Pelagivirga sediminicola]
MSLRARLLCGWLRQTEKRVIARAEDPATLRRRVERSARLFFHPPRGTVFDEIALGADLAATRVTPAKERRGAPLILYLHGGGYVFGAPRTHRAMMAQLAMRTGSCAVLPRYRLAPEHPFPAAIDDAMAAYRAVMDHPQGVILGGDSAGGGLALALLAQITQEGLRQPLATFCFSPLTDVTFSGDSFAANAEIDPLLPAHRAEDIAQMYLQGADPADPRASPLFAEFAGAAPVWLTVSDTEILLDDTRRMAGRLTDQGVDVTCTIAPGLPHVWPLMHVILPEARQTLDELAAWITSLSRR